MFKNYPKKGDAVFHPFRITQNIFSCGIGSQFKKGLSTTRQLVTGPTFLWKPLYGMDHRRCSPNKLVMARPILPFSKEVLFLIKSSRSRRRSLLIFEMLFPMPLFLCLFKTNQGYKVVS